MKAEMGRRSGLFYGWINVALFFVIALIIWGPQYSFGVFFKPLAEEFGWTRAETSAAMTLNLIVGGALGFLGGQFSDRYGPRKVMTVSALFIGAGYLLLSRLGSLWQLYMWFGVLVGMGMSTAYVVPAANISRWFIARRGIGLGITLMGLSFAQVLIPPVIALLIGVSGWQNTYALIGAGVLVLVFIMASFLKKSPEDCGLYPDGEKGVPCIAASNKALEGFNIKQSVKLAAFWLQFVLWILLAMPVFLTLVHVVPLATDVGVGPVEAAVIFSFIGAAGIGGRFIFGYTCDRWGCKASGALCMGIIAFAMVAILFARRTYDFYIVGTIFGLAYTGADTALVKLTGDFFGRRFIGAIMGLLGLGWRIGAGLGSLVGGLIFDITGKYQVSFVAGALCAVAALVLIIVIFRYKPELKTNH